MSDNQLEREKLGAELGFTICKPNQKAVLANGDEVSVSDEIGLSLDPKAFANRKCKTCNGEGIITTVLPIDKRNPVLKSKLASEMLTQDKPGKFSVRETSVCVCATVRRTRAQNTLMAAFVARGLATRSVERAGHISIRLL